MVDVGVVSNLSTDTLHFFAVHACLHADLDDAVRFGRIVLGLKHRRGKAIANRPNESKIGQ